MTNAGGAVEKDEPFLTVGGSADNTTTVEISVKIPSQARIGGLGG